MRHFFLKASGAVALAAASLAAHAVDGTITINGTVANNTCTVTVNGTSKDLTITLLPIAKTALATANSFAAPQSFSLNIAGCGTTPTTTPFFEPTSSGTTTITNNRLANTGSASGVEIQILNSSGVQVDLSKAFGSQNVSGVAVVSGTATHNFVARYYSTTGSVTPGTVAAQLAYTIIYQ